MIDSRTLMWMGLVLTLCSVTTACFPIMSGHEAFLDQYGHYVGKSVKSFREDYNYKNHYILKESILSNGNYEIEMDNPVPRSQCKVFYEYNPGTGIILAWRYIGGDNFHGCYVNPN